MYRKNLAILASLILITAFSGSGKAAVVVDSLQTPVWIERGTQRIALKPGMVINTADKIRTGGEGKLKLRLAEGSEVKLGENVAFEIEKLPPATAPESSLFSAAFDVLKGAFRFTTTLLGKDRRRDIEFRVGAATAGIRGTDLWGKATAERDFVVLLEGSIELSRDNAEPVIMDQPLTIFDVPSDGATRPVAAVDLEQLKRWAAETELDPGRGVISELGAFRVYLASYRDRAQALKLRDRLQNQGYPAEVFVAEVNGQTRSRLGIAGFDTYADAKFFTQQARQRLNIIDAWVDRS